MGPVHFVLDEGLLASSGNMHLPDALRSHGHFVHLERILRIDLDDQGLAETNNQCTVVYGSIRFVEQRIKNGGYTPGAYFSRNRFRCSQYLHRLPIEILGNGAGFYMPFGDFVRRRQQAYRLFGVSRLPDGPRQIFVRPDAGTKVFTGLVLSEGEDSHEIASMRALTSVTDETLVYVAPASRISAEYRFFIVEGEIITSSQYMADGSLFVSKDVDADCLQVAKIVANHAWQIDLAYSCDVGLFDGVAKVIELNAFSTSGLYACDGLDLFLAVANTAQREYEGLVSVSS